MSLVLLVQRHELGAAVGAALDLVFVGEDADLNETQYTTRVFNLESFRISQGQNGHSLLGARAKRCKTNFWYELMSSYKRGQVGAR